MPPLDRIQKKVPIILAAFGTTAKAFSTYERMDAVFKKTLPGHTIIWSYTSRMVKNALKNNSRLEIKDPGEVLMDLQQQGHPWAVLQSLHLIGAHELHRLAAERNHMNMRLSLGLPLLCSPRDYQEVSRALAPVVSKDEDRAIVVVGHGTDHPSWTAYFALEAIMRKEYGSRVFTGVVEGFPKMEETLGRIQEKGFKKVQIIPLLLVAGVHFIQDLTEEDDSWQQTFERNNIEVTLVSHGLGNIDGITEIFSRHIKEALDVIPL